MDTDKEVWKVLLWSFESLLRGTWPDKDPWNNPWDETQQWRRDKANARIMGRYFAALAQAGADLDYCCNVWKLRHFNVGPCCFLCGADHESRPWNDFRPGSEWMSTSMTLLEWYNDLPDHPLWTAYGFTVFSVCLDIMHILDLGVAQHLCGSVLTHLVHCYPGGGGGPFVGGACGFGLEVGAKCL